MMQPSNATKAASPGLPWTRILIVSVLLAAIIGVSWYRKSNQAVEVQVAPVARGALQDNILASGNLVYRTQVAMRSELMARVDAVFVKEGDSIKQDQLLLQLDKTSYLASVQQSEAQVARGDTEVQLAKSRLQNIARQLKRQQALVAQKLVQQETVDLLQNELQQAKLQQQAASQSLTQYQAALQQAKDLLAKTELRAPIDGVVITVDVKPGETVIPGSAQMMGSDLMTLADTSAVLAELRLDEADIHNVKIGQAVTVFAAAAPNDALQGTVEAIASSARQLGQSQALSFKVKVLLAPMQIALFPGMSCRAELLTDSVHDALSLPFSALLSRKTGSEKADNDSAAKRVWLVEDGRAVSREVTTGFSTDTAQQINSGLTGDELVITGPARLLESLSEGQKVRFTKTANSKTAASTADTTNSDTASTKPAKE